MEAVQIHDIDNFDCEFTVLIEQNNAFLAFGASESGDDEYNMVINRYDMTNQRWDNVQFSGPSPCLTMPGRAITSNQRFIILVGGAIRGTQGDTIHDGIFVFDVKNNAACALKFPSKSVHIWTICMRSEHRDQQLVLLHS